MNIGLLGFGVVGGGVLIGGADLVEAGGRVI